MSDLQALIERLESEESRELDAAVARALGFVLITAVLPAGPEHWQIWSGRKGDIATWDLPHYSAPEKRTASIAALKARQAAEKETT